MSKRKAKAIRKLVWEDMTVTRVNLNPEQAVLSCCDTLSRGAYLVSGQCWSSGSVCGASDAELSS